MSGMRGLNKVMVIGWLHEEPEVRQTPSGRSVASFSVSTSRSWTTSEGDRHEETEWFSVIAWGNLADLCRERLAAGQQVYIEGRLHTRSWDDDQGRKNFRTEIVAQEILVLAD
ncbi:MAG: single-stranded DNA-binding protein [Chloroflexota bacterium]